MTEKLNRDNVAVVLLETLAPGNIGATARAMTNMGFSDLRLVAPKADVQHANAISMAHGSLHTLENAKIFPSLTEAVADCCLLVASSHRKVRYSQESMSARELGGKIAPYCVNNKVAILFGREDRGLSNEEINLCTWVVRIPSASVYPALNLAQATMLICYELFMTEVEDLRAFPQMIGNRSLEIFYENVLEILDYSGFHHKNNNPEIFIGALRRILGRAGMEERDLQVLYKLFSQFKSIAEKAQIARECPLSSNRP